MMNIEKIANELFNQLRSRFSDITIGNDQGDVVNVPTDARYFDFVYNENDSSIGNVSISLDENEGIVIMFSNSFGENVADFQKDNWYNFLKEIRSFAKKRLLNFEVRDINKNNLQKRDYKTLSQNRSGVKAMAESKMYGTNKTSFQKYGNAKLAIKHSSPIEEGENRTKKIGSLFIENSQGEKFKYPFKHLGGARAMTIHVSEGGHPFDDFGKYITSLSEELSNLRKFKQYMARSNVMAESLAEHIGTVNERIVTVKKTIQNLQKPNYYKETFENFVVEEAVDVPDDVAENWIDQLTVKQFNEELKDVFPYIYKLIGESTKAQSLTFEDIMKEETGTDVIYKVQAGDTLYSIARTHGVTPDMTQDFMYDVQEINGLDDNMTIRAGEKLRLPAQYLAQSNIGSTEIGPNGQMTGSTRGVTEPTGDADNYPPVNFNPRAGHMDQPSHPQNRGLSDSIEHAIDKLMGQFATQVNEEDTDEGNAYAQAVRQAKMNGKKKGDKIQGPDGDEITLEKEKKTPLGEFILSYFDRVTGQFPKGETAVLTMVQKEYGNQFVRPAQEFIERIDAKVAEVMGYREADVEEGDDISLQKEFGAAYTELFGGTPQERQLKAIMQQHKGNPEAMLQAAMDLHKNDREFQSWWRFGGEESELGIEFKRAAGLGESQDVEEGANTTRDRIASMLVDKGSDMTDAVAVATAIIELSPNDRAKELARRGFSPEEIEIVNQETDSKYMTPTRPTNAQPPTSDYQKTWSDDELDDLFNDSKDLDRIAKLAGL